MTIRQILAVSRPRFWGYLLGPFVVGVAAAYPQGNWLPTVVMGLFFTLPANLFIYGINDIFDYETDRHNPKKQTYETLVTPKDRWPLLVAIAVLVVPFLGLVHAMSEPAAVMFGGFLLLGLCYSAPPIRTKTKPLLDSMTNVLYALPGFFAYGLFTYNYPPAAISLAALLWCAAMHAYSAVPDIAADRKAGLATIATWLGARGTIIFCLVCYLGAALASISYVGGFAVLGALVYGAIMLASLADTHRQQVFRLYRLFPYINMVMGGLLFLGIVTL